jgi:TatD DNase family protein
MKAQLIDSHCHLTSPGLREQVEAVLDRAAAAGVTRCITVAQDLADAAAALPLATNHPAVRVAAGVHPHEAARAAPGWEAELLQILRDGRVCAVGETGLDYHYEFSDRPSQRRVFRRHLELATEIGKPVVIHCREALPDVTAALAEFPRLTGVVFHCYSGTRAQARAFYDRGYWISLTGVVTFRNAEELRRVARDAPADRLMIETDAPWLSPEPVRRRRPNEPALLVHTAECIARQRGLSLEELAALTTDNARRFFSLAVE